MIPNTPGLILSKTNLDTKYAVLSAPSVVRAETAIAALAVVKLARLKGEGRADVEIGG